MFDNVNQQDVKKCKNKSYCLGFDPVFYKDQSIKHKVLSFKQNNVITKDKPYTIGSQFMN